MTLIFCETQMLVLNSAKYLVCWCSRAGFELATYLAAINAAIAQGENPAVRVVGFGSRRKVFLSQVPIHFLMLDNE